MNRYTAVRREANEANLIVSTNFQKRYTFDEVDVSQVVKDLLKDDSESSYSKAEESSKDLVDAESNADNEATFKDLAIPSKGQTSV